MTAPNEMGFNLKHIIKTINRVISPDGGVYTIPALVAKVDAGAGFGMTRSPRLSRLSPYAKLNLVTRALECMPLLSAGHPVPVFIVVNLTTGELTTPRPDRAVPIDNDDGKAVMIFEPSTNKEGRP